MQRFLLSFRVCAHVLLWLLGPLATVSAIGQTTSPPAGWTALQIRILDGQSKPIEAFTYQYTIKWKQKVPMPEDTAPLKGQHGKIEISAPEDCEVSVSIYHPDVVHGFGTEAVLHRKNGETVLDAKFQLGHRVTGTVVDAATGKPVAGASVSPLVFTPPLFTPDKDFAVTTKEDGSFELRGVDSSFAVEHPGFIEQKIYLEKKDPEKPQKVELQAGQTIRGVVTGADHRPLAEVNVTDGSGKESTTDKDGRFVLRGLRKWSGNEWSLSFTKSGFNDKDFRAERIDPEGLKLQLDPLPHLHGTVIFSDGSPATRYHLVCAPGPHPVDYRCVTVDVQDKDGRFDLRPTALPEQGNEYWIGVQAEGVAPWDELVNADKLTRDGFRVVLATGSTMCATFESAGSSTDELQVSMVPTDRQPEESVVITTHPGTALASNRVRLGHGTPLRLAHLRPGNYLLAVQGEGVTPISRQVTIGQHDLDLGRVTLPGVGSISGVVCEPDNPKAAWRFADGEIYLHGFGSNREPLKKFRADKQGRFQVNDVPTGEITVSFAYPASADVIEAVTRHAEVAVGENTEVRLQGLGGGWTQPVRLLFDGKKSPPTYPGSRTVDNVTDQPSFRLDVTPLSPGASSGPQLVEWTVEKNSAGPDIPDLSPGRWRFQVYDWLGSRGFSEGLRAEVTVEVPAANRQPIIIGLGSHMFSGKVTASTPTKRSVAVQAVAITGRSVFHSRCDDKGNFVIRYLPAGEYTVHAHDDDAGWCDLGTFRLDQPVVDCGEHQLTSGGSITGVLSSKLLPLADPATIKALAPDGVEILLDEVKADGTYHFGAMRPGSWVVLSPAEEGRTARNPIEIHLGQTVNLAGDNDAPPH